MSDEKKPEGYDEPWAAVEFTSSIPQYGVTDRASRIVVHPHTSNPEKLLRRAVACANLLAGVPTKTILACTKKPGEVQNEAAAMFLAFLKGDGLAALTYADEVQAQVNLPAGHKFVRRDEIEGENRYLARLNRAMTKVLGSVLKAVEKSGAPVLFIDHPKIVQAAVAARQWLNANATA